MKNQFLYEGIGNNNPFDALKAYIDQQIALVFGAMSAVRSGAAAPTATDIPAGKYAVWYNTTTTTAHIYYNNAGTITLIV